MKVVNLRRQFVCRPAGPVLRLYVRVQYVNNTYSISLCVLCVTGRVTGWPLCLYPIHLQ